MFQIILWAMLIGGLVSMAWGLVILWIWKNYTLPFKFLWFGAVLMFVFLCMVIAGKFTEESDSARAARLSAECQAFYSNENMTAFDGNDQTLCYEQGPQGKIQFWEHKAD